jgi:four helix bundle protein
MTYDEWLQSVPSEITEDPLWKMEVYRHALFAADLAWFDVSTLVLDQRTVSLSDQLSRAVDSVGANIAEGYSRRSGKDQARFYEYALGSAREARTWYYDGRHLLTPHVALHRIRLLSSIIRQLLTIIPHERGYKMSEERAEYLTSPDDLLNNVPLP